MDNLFENTEITEDPVVIKKRENKTLRKYYISTLWKLIVAILSIFVTQIAVVAVMALIAFVFQAVIKKQQFDFAPLQGYATYLSVLIGDFVGMLVLIICTLKNDKTKIHEFQKLSFGKWLIIFLCSYGVVGIGSIIGSLTTALLYSPFTILEVLSDKGMLFSSINYHFGAGGNMASDLMTMSSSWGYIILGVFVIGIFVPIMEEIIFRKLLIDNMSKYGISAAILVSALLFGLYHGNLSQFFYAFGLGIIFGAVYAYSGKVIYTILLHISINLYSSGVLIVLNNLINKNARAQITYALQQFQNGAITIDKYLQLSSDLVMEYPVSYGLVSVLYALAYGLVLLLEFVGFIVLIVFTVKHIKNRKQLVKGKAGSIKAAIFNWASIVVMGICACLFIFTFIGRVANSLITIFS